MVTPVKRDDPPYLQIVSQIRAKIADGKLVAGDRVPSARQIANDWGVALATATKVLGALQSDGLVEAKPGVGTVVRQSIRKAAQHFVSVAGAVIDADGRALLIRRQDNGHWEPPGGTLETDETIEDGLAREVAEETGLTVEIEALTGVYKNLPRAVVAMVFRCRPRSGDLALNPEVSEFYWAEDAELDDLMDPAFAIRVRDAMTYNGTPAIHAHDGVALIS